MLVACSEDIAQIINGGKKNFTATIAAPNSGGTRTAYNESGGDINVAWKVDDEIALVHDKVMDVVKVKTVNADGSATIDGTITSATDEATVQLVYPAARVSAVNSDGNPEFNEAVSGKLLTQDGTLTYIQNNIDFREGEGQLSVNGTEVTLNAAVDMVSSIAIWKLTLQDDAETPAAIKATQVSVIKDGETPETLASTATLSTATSTVYLAMPEMAEPETTVTIEAVTANGNYTYVNSGLTLAAGKYYQSTVTMAPAVTDLSTLTDNYTAKNGETLTGTLNGSTQKYKISIAAGATVTLDNATINGVSGGSDTMFAGINCEGDATIILKDETTNKVTGFSAEYPGIYVPSGNTLTIKGETAGTGKLTASSSQRGTGAGIGGGMFINCGNIEIQGGVITAYGGDDAAGIGSANNSSCGSITISGGTVKATSVEDGAGIGSGYYGTCGDINITGGTIEATGGANAAGIGSGKGAGDKEYGTCDNITISGGTVSATGGEGGAGIGSGYDGSCGNITITTGVTQVTATKVSGFETVGSGGNGYCGTVTIGGVVGTISTSPYTYDPSAPAAWAANEYNEASWDGTNSKVVYTKKSATNYEVVSSQTSSMITWDKAWLTVSGNVTLTGTVSLTQDVHLILQDGATLTINGQLDCRTSEKNLYIYGQDKGDGKLNVSYSDNLDGTAIYGDVRTILEIHGGEITAAATGNTGMGLAIDHFKMYGGKLTSTSKNTGIQFTWDSEVYGGEVVATTNSTSTSSPSNGIYGIYGVLTVYGGKVTATGNGKYDEPDYGSGFGCKVQSGTTGIKFYFSDDGTTWDSGTVYGTATTAPTNRYAKAE